MLLIYPASFVEDFLRELGAGAVEQAKVFFGVGIWLAGAWLVNELTHVLVWDRLVQRAMQGRPIPALLKHIVTVIILALTVTGIIGFVFKQSVSGIWATSGVVTLVFGFAARSLIADLFSGIAMHLDPPFKIGDWIEWRDGNEEVLARVVEINWRSTRVHARDDTKTIFIPNSILSAVSVVNVFAPQGRTRQIIAIPLDPGVDVERAARVMLAAALKAEGPLDDPPPDVLVNSVDTSGIVFHVRYWHDPIGSFSKVQDNVLKEVLAALSHAGIPIARIRQELLQGPLPSVAVEPKDALWNLRRIEIFRAFSEEELMRIAAGATRRELQQGEVIVRQGEPGSSLYFVMEGLLDVLITQEGREPLRVSRLGQGQYFGEMSLLTGDLRSATVQCATSAVVFAVEKYVLEPILRERPELVQVLATTIAERQLQNQAELAKNTVLQNGDGQQTFAAQLLGKIRNFFGAGVGARN
ncbi:MAG: mechanosensitive ion channel family protein [Bryobacter sp.]|nr:mechanosensitive ion channel family protein [Bryobacter sp.]